VSDLIAETRQSYCGPLAVGDDLMCFDIADEVVVRRRPFDSAADAKSRLTGDL
jgi:hypothetical protein